MKEHETFFVSQKALIGKGDELLILQSNDAREYLDFPGGRLDRGEDNVVDALKREVREEANIEIRVDKPFATWINDFPANHSLAGKKVFIVAYICEYVSGDIVLSNEHAQYRWVNKHNYKEADDGAGWGALLEKYFENYR